MGLGMLLGLALLGNMRPGQVGSPSDVARRAAPALERDLTVVRPSPRPLPAAPAPAPRAEVQAQLDASPADTGEGPREALVLVDVVDAEGRPTEGARVYPVDCPGFRSGARGSYVADPGRCTLRAARRDGALFARGPTATATLVAGEIEYLQLELGSDRTGGIGVRFQAEPGGMRVVSVSPDTPAFAAGLEPGDLIVAVGDQSVEGLDGDSFVEIMTGPEGTEVDFTISYATEAGMAEESLRVIRQFLDG